MENQEEPFEEKMSKIDWSKMPFTQQELIALRSWVNDIENHIEEECPNPNGLADSRYNDLIFKIIFPKKKNEDNKI